MISQVQAQEAPAAEVVEPLESNIVSLEESPDGETHETIGVDGEEHVSGVFPPFDATTYPSQLLWLVISFAALYFIMKKVALPRIGVILEERRDRIEGDLAEAERLRQKTDQAIASYEAALAEARSNAHAIAEQARGENKTKLDAERSKVEANLVKKVAAAEERISATKAEAMGHVDEIAAETAQAVVAQLIGKVPVKAARDAVAKVKE
ncbi:F0F1 ATP synthase subunit B [Pelagibacterium luteolum]|uniref:ATP synthase subunit b n=1 Tax=Pelagibacterium luteolum TaxID=440168 RepID=A0A1G7TY66_9HYPH|nr:F0F1 ATP synthase subunit B [Pelagibacterium luteolum]SDG40021.1 F-type H+-transporting ATPase subunit b [Pelagibacterium luteolum]